MAGSPVKIKDFLKPIESTRKEFLEEENTKIKGKKGFSFKAIKYENYKPSLEPYTPATKDEYKEKPANKFVQPSMRFKARTDLERIFDVINNFNYGSANKKIISNQLKNLELNGPQKQSIVNGEDILLGVYNKAMEIASNKKDNDRFDSSDQINTSFTAKRAKRKMVDNSGAKNLMKDLYFKTHFKAASVYTVLKNSSRYMPSPAKNYGLVAEEQTAREVKEIDDRTTSSLASVLPTMRKRNRRKTTFSANESIDENFMKYAYINPYLNKENQPDTFIPSDEQLKYLRKISSVPYLVMDESKKKKNVKFIQQQQLKRNSFSQNTSASNFDMVEDTMRKKDEEKIRVDGEILPKNEINLIANKVLRSCNFYHKKNKNNDTFHKKNGGKLMQTMGLPVSEFLEKTNLAKFSPLKDVEEKKK